MTQSSAAKKGTPFAALIGSGFAYEGGGMNIAAERCRLTEMVRADS